MFFFLFLLFCFVYFILFYFILLYFILFYFILFYFILFYFIYFLFHANIFFLTQYDLGYFGKLMASCLIISVAVRRRRQVTVKLNVLCVPLNNWLLSSSLKRSSNMTSGNQTATRNKEMRCGDV